MTTDMIIGILLIIFHAAAAVDVYLRVGIRQASALHDWVARAVMILGVIGLLVGLAQAEIDPPFRLMVAVQVIPPALILIGMMRVLWSVRTSTVFTYVVGVPIAVLVLASLLSVGPETDTVVIAVLMRASLALLAIGHIGFASLQMMRVPSGRPRAISMLAVLSACALFSLPVFPFNVPMLVVDVLATSLLWFSVRRSVA
jgi:hypothetical protein